MELIYIYADNLQTITRGAGDVTGIPPTASLIVSAPEWEIMCAAADGEAALIASLGVTDRRGEEPWALSCYSG